LLTQEELKEVFDEVTAELEAAVDFAMRSPLPDPEEAYAPFLDIFKVS
jgi:TPP-dependent pyruvate/acetoin dehydrogenase alpha subunit